MADRDSADIFGTVFRLLAENPTAEHKAMAARLYDMTQRYDFSDEQMDADEACVILGVKERRNDDE